MVWATRIEAYSILQNEQRRLEENISRDKSRRFQIFLSLLALYGAFFMANIAFQLKGIAIWLILLILGGIFFIYTLCWNLFGVISIRGFKDEKIKDITIEKGLSSINGVQLVMIILSVCFVLPSFYALHVPFLDFRYIGFIIIHIYVLVSSVTAYLLIHRLEQKSMKWFSLSQLIKLLKSIPGTVIMLVFGVIPIALLVIGTFMNIKYYWIEGVLSYNLIIFLVFAQVITSTLLIYITAINISINQSTRYSNELKTKMKNLFINQDIDLKELSEWYTNFINQY